MRHAPSTRPRATATAAALAAAVALVGAHPAAADPLPPYTPTTLTVTATAVGLLGYGDGDGTGTYVAARCDAVVQGAVAATVIEECRLYAAGVPGSSRHPAGLPGNAAASAYHEWTGWWYPYPRPDDTLCVTAYTIPLHAPDAPLRLQTCTEPDAFAEANVWTPWQSGESSVTR